MPKEEKIKCDLCPRNKQPSKKKGARCLCCDINESTCKHRHGTRHEKQVTEKERQAQIKWPVVNPFTDKVEEMLISEQVELNRLYRNQ